MHMSAADLLILQTAADVLDRHGYASGDLRSCMRAAEQANEDERLDDAEPSVGDEISRVESVPAGPTANTGEKTCSSDS